MFGDPQPVFGIDVTNLSPEVEVVFELSKFWSPEALGFGYGDMLPGTYYAQALVDLDHLHAGYHNTGNLYSPMAKCHVAAGFKGGRLKLVMDKAMDQEAPVKDTEWVKRVEIRSKLLSDFHGREVMLRAGVIVPSTFREKPDQQFPALYEIGGFGSRYTDTWWLFEDDEEGAKKWKAGQCPLQMLHVFLDGECPWGDTAFANSANNGPVGDALVQELIPEIERRFRAIPHSYARFLTGFSTGGWASLWLQVNYPDFFGGCWSMSPDPVDFSAFQTMNIYEDRNGHWTREGYPRPLGRVGTKVVLTFPQIDLWDYVVGTGYPLGSFNAVFSPRGADGRPQRLINQLTGRIDPEVAAHWRRYDIVSLLKQNWGTLGPKLKGKLHVVDGGSDTYYLDAAVDNLRAFLKTTDYGGYVQIYPGDHSNYRSPELMDRFSREMAEHFAAGLKGSPER
jgi:S-formylglutathione hydrolase FrmB